MLFDMVDGAAGDEITMRNNEAALAADGTHPCSRPCLPERQSATSRSSCSASDCRRRSSSARPASRACCGRTPNSPQPARRRGSERSTAQATPQTATIEEIGAATPGPKWMQVFLYKDRGLTAEFARAAAAGYKALILTVDNQVVAGRDRDARNRLTFPLRWGPRSVIDFLSRAGLAHADARDAFADFVNYGKRTSIGAFGPLMVERLKESGCRLERCRATARAMAWPTRPQGPSASGRGARGDQPRRRRNRCLQSWRTLDGAITSIRALPGIVFTLCSC